MAKNRIKWYGDAVNAEFNAKAKAAMRIVVQVVRSGIVRRISTSARAGGMGGPKGRRSPKRNTKAMRFNHSKPGQPPHKDTGTLARSIFGQVDPVGWHGGVIVGRVGTTVKYGAYLELGVKKSRTVTAKRKKTLAFGYNGTWVFPKVSHPGPIAPRPFIHSTIKMMRPQIHSILATKLKAGKLRLG